MLKFIFCHGWSTSSLFWKNLVFSLQAFCPIIWELGYFSKKNTKLLLPVFPDKTKTTWIGVGHSLGLIKLLKTDIPFQGFISLQGFTNFLGEDPSLKSIRKQELDIMLKNFQNNPLKTLSYFHKICGLDSLMQQVHISDHNVHFLQNDLTKLYFSFNHLVKEKPILALGSLDDTVVPIKLIEDNFSSLKNSKIIIHKKGKHGLGYFYPSWCAKQIKNFINTIS